MNSFDSLIRLGFGIYWISTDISFQSRTEYRIIWQIRSAFTKKSPRITNPRREGTSQHSSCKMLSFSILPKNTPFNLVRRGLLILMSWLYHLGFKHQYTTLFGIARARQVKNCRGKSPIGHEKRPGGKPTLMSQNAEFLQVCQPSLPTLKLAFFWEQMSSLFDYKVVVKLLPTIMKEPRQTAEFPYN